MDEFLDELRNDHSDFEQGSLDDQLKQVNPMDLFTRWYKEAFDANCPEPNAMTISTVGKNLKPSSRVVYLKELAEEGLVFYTNYESQKGKEIAENPYVSILFFWESLGRQIRVLGKAEKVASEVSDEYFNSRPRESRLGAWASKQSQEITNRKVLEDAVKNCEKDFEGKEVTRPPYWGGYVIKIEEIEFWQGRPNRLHDRICFSRNDLNSTEWKVVRKNP